MAGKLILRFDDICPTMNWPVWQQIEHVLLEADVKPLVAVIPDNKDPNFHICPPRRDFWERVRLWNALGWTIGVHGYQHAYVTECSGLMGINRASEFAGLPFSDQERKIRSALRIFGSEGLAPSVWIAPGHSFDVATLRVLSEVGLRVMSDGLNIFPYEDGRGILWVPQQMWRFRGTPFGVWTICLHHNFWRNGEVARFRGQLAKYRKQIVGFAEVVAQYRGRTRGSIDGVSAMALGSLLRTKLAVRRRFSAVNPVRPLEAQ
jgi:predicted deacetylase